MFGYKVRTLKTEKEYTLRELFETIKSHDFRDAGKPAWQKFNMAHVIAFAPVDVCNQVWITQPIAADYMKLKSRKFTIFTSHYGNAIEGYLSAEFEGDVTDHTADLKTQYDSNEKVCEKQVEEIWQELCGMGL